MGADMYGRDRIMGRTRRSNFVGRLAVLALLGGLVAAPTAALAQDGQDGGTTAAAQLTVLVNQLQNQVRDLTGQVEELTHQQNVLSDRLDKYMKDSEFRFEALEKGKPGGAMGGAGAATGAGAAGAASPAAGRTASAGAPVPLTRGASGADTSPSAPGVQFVPGLAPHPLGEIPANTPLPQASAGGQASAGAEANAAPAGALPSGSTETQYNYATGLLRKGQYDQAEGALTAFIHAHPGDPLASSAQFWLGETFYVRKQYDKAAAAFLTGYRKYPKSEKAPDDLLKLGASLTNLHQKQEACATFTQLSTQFPHAEERIKQAARRERQRAGCQ